MKRKIIAIGLLTPGYTSLAMAQLQTRAQHSNPLMPLYECLKIDESSNRLTCLEQTTQSIRMQENNREILAFDAQYADKIRQEAFGFYLPSLPNAGVPRLANANTEISNTQSFECAFCPESRS